MPELTEHTASDRLLRLLTESEARSTPLRHPPEGQTARAGVLRGHPLAAAATRMVVTVAGGPAAGERQVLSVVPGDRRVDFARVARECGGAGARLARRKAAEALTGCVSGSIVPFSCHDRLPVPAGPARFDEPTLYVNAARLDLSVALAAEDHRTPAGPKAVPVTEPPGGAAAL